MKVLKNFFANIPYNLTDRQNEQMWQAIVYVILKSVGFGVNAEVLTNEGRIDMTCETAAGIWLIEFKLDRPAEEALAQIDERNYAEKYDFAGKTVRKLGISFSSEQRTIVDVKVCRREGRLMTKSVWSLFAGLTLGVALVSVGAESAANECA